MHKDAYPVADILIEDGGAPEHGSHVGGPTRIPRTDGVVEGRLVLKERREIGHLGNIPIVDGRSVRGIGSAAGYPVLNGSL